MPASLRFALALAHFRTSNLAVGVLGQFADGRGGILLFQTITCS